MNNDIRKEVVCEDCGNIFYTVGPVSGFKCPICHKDDPKNKLVEQYRNTLKQKKPDDRIPKVSSKEEAVEKVEKKLTLSLKKKPKIEPKSERGKYPDGTPMFEEFSGFKKDERISKDLYYLNIAKDVCMRGTCLRRNYGAVIVKNDEIIATGYTGAPRGRKNCCEIGKCIRNELNVPRGERYELCRSVHAEMNAIISASRKDMIGATLYLFGMDVETGNPVPKPRPCTLCERMIINAGIKTVVCYDESIYGCVHKDVEESYVEHDSSLSK